jgi:hypothetical protein
MLKAFIFVPSGLFVPFVLTPFLLRIKKYLPEGRYFEVLCNPVWNAEWFEA